MGKSFDLGSTLADVLKNVSDPDRGPEQIVMLPLASIDADANNFYSMDGVEELAENIELIGLLDPLRVRENPDMPGRYLIVSGHRRRAALWTLFEEDPEKWAKAPCIVEQPAASPELQELRLIYANADTRKMTSADLSAQAQRVEMLLYELKNQGMEFPGRMRDHVAEACKVSATRLAQLKVIREKLFDDLLPLWEDGTINESCAYTLAKEPVDVQIRLLEAYGAEVLMYWPQWRIENAIAAVRDPAPEPAETPEPTFDPPTYQKQLDKENAMLRKAVREGFGRELAREVSHYSCYHRQQAIDWMKKAFRQRGFSGPNMIGYDGRPNGLEVKIPKEEKFLAHWCDLFDQLALWAIEELDRQNKEKQKTPKEKWEPAWISVDDRYPAEGDYCLVFTASHVVLPSVYFRASFMDFAEKSVANNRIQRVEYWMPLPKAPGDHKYMGQETLDSILNRSDAK